MAYSTAKLIARLKKRPLRARFSAAPLIVELYEEDPTLLPPMTTIEDDEDPMCAGGGLVSVLSLVWLAGSEGVAPQLLYRNQGWESPLRKGGTYYESALLELQLMLRALPDYASDMRLEDYTVEGVLFLSSRMGFALAGQVGALELSPASGKQLLTPLAKSLGPGGAPK